MLVRPRLIGSDENVLCYHMFKTCTSPLILSPSTRNTTRSNKKAYTYMYKRDHVQTHTHTLIRTHTHPHTHTRTRTHTHTYKRMHTNTRTHAHTLTYTYICTRTHKCVNNQVELTVLPDPVTHMSRIGCCADIGEFVLTSLQGINTRKNEIQKT